MDGSPALDSLARLLTHLPDESVEGLLVTFDALLAVSGPALRPTAAQMLRQSAVDCDNSGRRERLLLAADAVASGSPCAFTPDGLSASQAATASTVTQQQWDAPIAINPFPPLPGDDDTSEVAEAEDADDSYMEEAPPPLPHLPVRHFFPGLVVRIGKDFRDHHGRAVCSGELLSVLLCETCPGGYAVAFLDRNVVLTAGHEDVIENSGNAYFQPVPTAACLEELLDAIDLRLSEAEDQAEDADSEDDQAMETLDTLRDEVATYQDWLSRRGERGPVPKTRGGQLAAGMFGRDHELTAWLRFLADAAAVCAG